MKNLLFLSYFLMALTFTKSPDPKVGHLKLQDGFKAEHIYSPSENNQGSWVSMCFDNKGRLITSDQYGGLYRLSIPKVGAKNVSPIVEKLKTANDTLGAAHGLLYAFNSLYVLVNNRKSDNLPRSSGFYRLQDTNGDDQYDKVTLLKELTGSGEHGPHSIKLSPDGKSLFIICGNFTDMPEMDFYALPNTWKYDNLLPEIKDPRGHANERKQPGGWVANVSPDGKTWNLISAGFRNPFDMAFNDQGDLFVYDADMEYDFGLPWYRPTRICHASNGSEFGWRTGNGKWQANYPDTKNAIINIGQGSPTNLLYLKEAKFPKKYSQSLLAFDWSFGIMHAIHLKPNGSTYIAEREEFLSGIPLPLTDGVIGPDGALYFLTGGRRLQSDLYRVYYNGDESTDEKISFAQNKENKLRRTLESYQKVVGNKELKFAWGHLDNSDRDIQYAARIVLEHQPLVNWKEKALKEKAQVKKIYALLALVRASEQPNVGSIINALTTIKISSLSETQKVDLFRVYEVLIARNQLSNTEKESIINKLNPVYPAKSNEENKLLCKVLLALDAPKAVSKTLQLLKTTKDLEIAGGKTATQSAELIARNPQYGLDIAKMLEKMPPSMETFYAIALSKAQTGWKDQLREDYFSWFKNAFEYRGGRSYVGFLNAARNYALENLPEGKKDYFNEISGGSSISSGGLELTDDDYPKGPGKKWTMNNASPLFKDKLEDRNFKVGKAMYNAITCVKCHTIQGEGGTVGPDLTQLGTRFTIDDMLEAIIDPGKTVSDQFAAIQFQLKNGETIIGSINKEDNENFYVSLNPYAPDYLETVPKSSVLSKSYSSVSLMLPGLINSLNEEELKDLIAYLKAGGNEDNEVFK